MEAAHVEGLAYFLRKSELFHLDMAQALIGFLEILKGMAQWWDQLADRAKDIT
ncbi:hypothetical protein OH787_05355 [Streptomyces sp. NBC_01547]|uniref:hypothetical protein n=1 Tax=Streptomyces sp. NBC_01547 TaxID=2975873 RepID=UPI003868B00B